MRARGGMSIMAGKSKTQRCATVLLDCDRRYRDEMVADRRGSPD